MKKIVVAVALVATSVGAFAWGEREQGVLVGIASTLIFQHIQRQQQPPVTTQPPPPVVIANGGVITDRQMTCISRPVLFDQFTGAPIRFETVCR